MRVLVAVDGSPCSNAVIAEIASRPWPAHTEFKVITAYEMPLIPTPEAWAISADYYNEIEHAAHEQAQTTSLAASVKLLQSMPKSSNITSQTFAGSAKSVILEQAEAWNADLILLGSHGYSAWERFLLGSVSQAVVSHARCSVEVVRCKAMRRKRPEAA